MTRGFLHFEGVLWNELPAFATKNLAFQKEANLIEDRGACAPRHYSQALSARDDIKMTCVHRTRLKLVARIAQKIAEALPRESIFSVHAPCWVLYCNKVRIFSKDISFTYKKTRLLRYIEILRIIVIYESLIDARFVPPSYHLLMRFAISSRSTIVLGPVWGNPGRCNKMNSICISRIGLGTILLLNPWDFFPALVGLYTFIESTRSSANSSVITQQDFDNLKEWILVGPLLSGGYSLIDFSFCRTWPARPRSSAAMLRSFVGDPRQEFMQLIESSSL